MVPEKSSIGQVRTLRTHLESMHCVVLNPNMCIWSWLTRHASCLMSRLTTRASARTAYEEAFDSEWKGDLCVFGTTIFFQVAESKTGALVKGRRRREADVTWHRGLWLGRAEQTNEHVVGTELGVFLKRGVRRPEEQRGDKHVANAVKGVPWEARQGSKMERPRR